MRFGFLLFLLLTSYLVQAQPETAQRPNMVWIIAEDLSQDLGCYGNAVVQTPHIDRLAAEGVKFTNVFTTAPVCTPSRTSLITGMYQTSLNAHHMRYPDSLKHALPQGVVTLNDLFRKKGYLIANLEDKPGTGKTDWSFQVDLSKQYAAHHWKELAGRDKPVFVQINTHHTHRPFQQDTQETIDKDRIQLPPYYPDNKVVRQDWANYYHSIETLDEEVGNIMDTLQSLGLLDNTIVMFFSDHGRPMTRGKMWNYDSGLEIPLIVKFFGDAKIPSPYHAGESVDRLISSIDITATSLALAGFQKPAWMQGAVFWGENSAPERTYVFSATDRIGEIYLKSRSVRSKKYRYIRNYHHDFSVNSASTAYRKANHPIYHVLHILHEQNALNEVQRKLVEPLPYEELYDLENDPYEIHNLASEAAYQDVLKKMQKVLDDWIQRTHDKGMEKDSEALVQAFDAYGRQSEEQHQAKIRRLHAYVLSQLQDKNP